MTMKKMFVAVCSALPGGMVLAVTMMLFVGCARLQYQDAAGNVQIRGYTLNPEAAMVMSAEAEAVRAQSYAVRSCSEDPRHCGAVWGAFGAYGMDTPAGYTWAGIRAVGAGGSTPTGNGDLRRDVADIKRKVNAMDKGQDAFFRALKNQKKGKR